MATDVTVPSASRPPLWLKLACTAFTIVLVPVYWHHYGPTNFLYFCDAALFLTLVGLWIDGLLLISMCAVGILAPQAIWGPSDNAAQTWVSPHAWLASLLIGMPALLFWPAHVILNRHAPQPA